MKWTEADKKFIAANYLDIDDYELAKRLDRTLMSVRTYRYKTGLRREKKEICGHVWIRITKWVIREHAISIMERMEAQGVCVELRKGPRRRGKDTVAVWRKMQKKQWRKMPEEKCRNIIRQKGVKNPIPLISNFDMSNKNPWDVRSSFVYPQKKGE